MTVTRSKDYPPEVARLFQSFNTCADGFTTGQVLDAAANFFIAAIANHVRANGGTLSNAKILATAMGAYLVPCIEDQWSRVPAASDVEVGNGH